MSLAILIRPFVPTDQPAARRLILSGLGEHFGIIDETRNPDVDDIQRHYVEQDHLFLVAELDGELVGTAALVRESASAVLGSAGRVVRVSVARACRRRGIARVLVTRLLAEARTRGFARVLVETNLDWQDALGLYKALGFEEYARDEESRHLSFVL